MKYLAKLYATAAATGTVFAVWLIGVIARWFPTYEDGSGPGAMWLGGFGVFAALAGVVAFTFAVRIANEHTANLRTRRAEALTLLERFRTVYTEPQGTQVRVLVKGDGMSPAVRGSFDVDDEDALLDCLTRERHLAAEHRERVLRAESLSKTVNR